MRILKDILHFFVNGFSVFKKASFGEYRESSHAIEKLKHEMFVSSKLLTDKDKLKRDRANIAHDFYTAFSKEINNKR